MNITIIQKPAPNCPIPFGHPLYRGYVPADKTDIRDTFKRYADDYDLTDRLDWLEPGGFRS